jgi:hypothetical protein
VFSTANVHHEESKDYLIKAVGCHQQLIESMHEIKGRLKKQAEVMQ